MSQPLPGVHYCNEHQGNHSHYATENCEVCRLRAEVASLKEEAKTARIEAECLAASCKAATDQLAAAQEQIDLLGVQGQEGWKLVPVEILKNIYMLIDPPPIEADGKVMVFKNPKAADILTKISAEVRALLDSAAPAALPQQVKSEDARDAARYRLLREYEIDSYIARGSHEKLDSEIDTAISAQEEKA